MRPRHSKPRRLLQSIGKLFIYYSFNLTFQPYTQLQDKKARIGMTMDQNNRAQFLSCDTLNHRYMYGEYSDCKTRLEQKTLRLSCLRDNLSVFRDFMKHQKDIISLGLEQKTLRLSCLRDNLSVFRDFMKHQKDIISLGVLNPSVSRVHISIVEVQTDKQKPLGDIGIRVKEKLHSINKTLSRPKRPVHRFTQQIPPMFFKLHL
ncbi:Hypothetical predicted protein [Scomber scombrus]|uniref:Uncharacterized protein n=1 Tax=Scomber scombrus TaxID=13677 RepID=A0AAV1PM70_SCOSC